MLISIRVPATSIRRKGAKTKIKYDERLKRILMTTRKNKVAMRKLKSNISQEECGNYLNYLMFADEIKHFS